MEQQAKESQTNKTIDRKFRFMIAQTVICVIFLAVVGICVLIGGNAYDYVHNRFCELFDKPINVEQVLGANEARAVIAMQSTQYGIGGSGESADKKTTLYSEDKEIVKKISVNEMCYPLDEYYITSEFGGRTDPISGEYSYHSGTDMGADTGSNIYAALSGTVKKAVWDSWDYGNYVVISHSDGFDTLYAHCDTLLCKEGDVVEKGDVIALVGSTGRSTGPHLHFEVRINDKRLDPKWFIDL
ncbi:MAG: M23 family metallopeptidase [Clostridia bacterium]|nr:M23 family metallopeptidase [Clostridia bacterium]